MIVHIYMRHKNDKYQRALKGYAILWIFLLFGIQQKLNYLRWFNKLYNKYQIYSVSINFSVIPKYNVFICVWV